MRNRPAAERQTAEQHRPSRPARPDLGQRSGAWSAEAGLAHGEVAGRLSRLVIIALRTCARPCRAQQAGPGEAIARVAADRVAPGGSRADQILALDTAGERQLPTAFRCCRAALAQPTRLSCPQGEGRAWSRLVTPPT